MVVLPRDAAESAPQEQQLQPPPRRGATKRKGKGGPASPPKRRSLGTDHAAAPLAPAPTTIADDTAEPCVRSAPVIDDADACLGASRSSRVAAVPETQLTWPLSVAARRLMVAPDRCDVAAPTASIERGTVVPLRYDELVNFDRAKDKKSVRRCVMCGKHSGECCIPLQNKDVCKDCDSECWRHAPTGTYFRWCKGCKKFLHVVSFAAKLHEVGLSALDKAPAKCDSCRARGRQSYLMKRLPGGAADAHD